MIQLIKILYVKDLRQGRWLDVLLTGGLLLLSEYFDIYIFFSLLIIMPNKFLNPIWSDTREIIFYFINIKNNITEIVIANKVNIILEINILFLLISLAFKGYISSERFLELNLFIFTYLLLSDFIFLLSLFKNNKLIKIVFDFSILVIGGQVLLVMLLFFEFNVWFKLAVLFIALVIQIASLKMKFININPKNYTFNDQS